ncbi:MAG: putative anti-sigma factor antagonist [Phycisphaeraceae bacterium]|nr:MAG: putative anti-sigma factor antagonist [Phycisphaeraceae bacterium]
MGDPEIVSVNADATSGAMIVAPRGDVDMSRSPVLRQSLRDVQGGSPARVVVNLSDVDYMDSSGLATLVEAMRAAKGANTKMILCGMNDKVRAIFEIARLHHFFTIVDSVDQAVEA